jgi:hypothetical protein
MAVLCARRWKVPNAINKVELAPTHARHFAATLRGQEQHMEQGAERIAILPAHGDDAGDLIISQHPLTCVLLARRFDAIGWASSQDTALDAPIEHAADVGKEAVGLGIVPFGDHIVEDRNDVGTTDLTDVTFAIGAYDLADEQRACRFPTTRFDPRIFLDIVIHDVAQQIVGHFSDEGRVDAFLRHTLGLICFFSDVFEGIPRIDADLDSPLLGSVTDGNEPRFVAIG